MKIVLLPGLDGTGNLFNPLLKAIPQNSEVIVVSYPDVNKHAKLTHFRG